MSKAKKENEFKEKATHLATREDLANVKTDMIKWFVGLFVVMVLMIIGLYFK